MSSTSIQDILFKNNTEWNTDTCNNTDRPHIDCSKSRFQRLHILWFDFGKIKSYRDVKKKMELPGAGSRGGLDHKEAQSSLLWWWNCLYIDFDDVSRNMHCQIKMRCKKVNFKLCKLYITNLILENTKCIKFGGKNGEQLEPPLIPVESVLSWPLQRKGSFL